MNEKIIFEGKSSKNVKFIIRYPNEKDAGPMHEYINKLSVEKTFVNYQGEKIRLEEEKEYLKDELTRIKKLQSVLLLVFLDSKIIGISNIDLGEGASSHEGIMGISILKEYRNEGIGKILLNQTIKESENNLKNLELITLSVFGNNQIAYDLYKKLGFREFGRLPNGVNYKGKYYDRIYMFKSFRKYIDK